MPGKFIKRAAALLSALCLATAGWAETTAIDTGASTDGKTSEGGPGCYDAEVFSGKLISGLCWDCIFPVVVSAGYIGDKGRVPEGAATEKYLGSCICYDHLGLPKFGFRTSMWEPARMIEHQRQSGCLGVLGGVRMPFNRLAQGTEERISKQPDTGESGRTYRHYHYFSFPLMYMMNLFIPSRCNPGGYIDLDIMYLSEVDPTWNNDEISFFTHPEAAMIASPLGAIACIPDVFAANIGKPLKELFWCAGSWGVIYPTTGNVLSHEGTMNTTSLMATRALYALHRRGLEWRSIGEDVLCGGSVSPYLPKTQYRFQVFHPIAETSDNHVLGETVFTWGLGRKIPAVGEDPVYVIWRWLDCCNTSS